MGIQQNVMAIGKHYMLNNQETDRSGVNEIVDEKTMMELYFPAFEAMAPHVSGYMCAYNRINNHYACENNHTLNNMLKGYANFSGFIVSDWGATHSTSDAINAGLDIDMPSPVFFSETLIQAAIQVGNITTAQIHSTCIRIMVSFVFFLDDIISPFDRNFDTSVFNIVYVTLISFYRHNGTNFRRRSDTLVMARIVYMPTSAHQKIKCCQESLLQNQLFY